MDKPIESNLLNVFREYLDIIDTCRIILVSFNESWKRERGRRSQPGNTERPTTVTEAMISQAMDVADTLDDDPKERNDTILSTLVAMEELYTADKRKRDGKNPNPERVGKVLGLVASVRELVVRAVFCRLMMDGSRAKFFTAKHLRRLALQVVATGFSADQLELLIDMADTKTSRRQSIKRADKKQHHPEQKWDLPLRGKPTPLKQSRLVDDTSSEDKGEPDKARSVDDTSSEDTGDSDQAEPSKTAEADETESKEKAESDKTESNDKTESGKTESNDKTESDKKRATPEYVSPRRSARRRTRRAY